MLRHLVGANLQAPGIGSLETLIGLIEPVKHYERGGQQIWSNQLIPLVGLADAAQADSAPSRAFAGDVERMLFAPGAIDRSQADSIAARLQAWSAAGREVSNPLAGTYPAVREALPAAGGLVAAAAAGSEAVQSLVTGVPLGGDRLAASLASLEREAAPNESATELPILKPTRMLVAAAAKQAGRAGMPDDQWRMLVVSTAFPVPAADAVPPGK
jgi:hypothetical protein